MNVFGLNLLFMIVQSVIFIKHSAGVFLGTADTIAIGWLISGDPYIGLQIGLAEVITKMILYFIHEKVWYKFKFGLKKNNA